MLRIYAVVLALVAASGPPAVAGQLHIVDVPTPGMPGYCTYFLSYETNPFGQDLGEELRSFSATFSGDIHQVNPFGVIPTIFTDSNHFFPFDTPAKSVLQDSQFLFQSDDVLTLGKAESNALLMGNIYGLSRLDLPNPTPLAQVVTRNSSDVSMSLLVDNGLEGESYGNFFANLGIPSIDAQVRVTAEPATGLPGYHTYTLWLSSSGTAEGILIDAQITGSIYQGSDQQSTAFRSEASEAQRALDSHFYNDESRVLGGEFALSGSESPNHLSAVMPLEGRTYGEWIETGAPFAQITTNDPASVDYHLSITFCDIAGAPNELILAGALVPEPHSVLLAGLTFVGTFGCGTRRRRIATRGDLRI